MTAGPNSDERTEQILPPSEEQMIQKNEEFLEYDYQRITSKHKTWTGVLKGEREKEYQDKERKRDVLRSFSRNDIFLRFTYDYLPGKGVPVYLSCFVIPGVLLFLFLFFGYYTDTLIAHGSVKGIIQITTFALLAVALPLGLIMLWRIYDKYYDTFVYQMVDLVDHDKLKDEVKENRDVIRSKLYRRLNDLKESPSGSVKNARAEFHEYINKLTNVTIKNTKVYGGKKTPFFHNLLLNKYRVSRRKWDFKKGEINEMNRRVIRYASRCFYRLEDIYLLGKKEWDAAENSFKRMEDKSDYLRKKIHPDINALEAEYLILQKWMTRQIKYLKNDAIMIAGGRALLKETGMERHKIVREGVDFLIDTLTGMDEKKDLEDFKTVVKRIRMMEECYEDIQIISDIIDYFNLLDSEDYESFIGYSFWGMKSENVKYYHLMFGVGGILFTSINFFFYRFSTDIYHVLSPVDGFLFFLLFTSTWVIVWLVLISIAWDCLTIVRSIRRYCLLPLNIRPIDPDKAAGLKPLASLALSLDLLNLLAIFTSIYAIVIVGLGLFDFRVTITVSLVGIMTILLFILPLSKAHQVMKNEKEKLLETLSKAHYQLYSEYIEFLEKRDYRAKRMKDKGLSSDGLYPYDDQTRKGETTYENLKNIEETYQRAEKMPVWPFDYGILVRVASIFALNLLIIPIQIFITILGSPI